MIGLLLFLAVGLAAGWLAGKIMGKGFGLIGNLVIGVIGAFLGSFLFNKFTSSAVAWGEFSIMGLVTAVVGAMLLLWVVGLVKKSS
ncbi:MAG: GlsB/YeaQ/YmgE family stress response membrane protein [Caldithrix sp.]|nr:MAG: GlsB/YeaQ/YmgE family stress response membrane protein [Caldithrix sp.]